MNTIERLFSGALVMIVLNSCDEQPKKEQAPPVVIAADTAKKPSPGIAENAYASVDISPMDMSYFPVDYAKLKTANATTEPPVIRLIYSRPHLQRRALFNGILKYDEPWRLGANEASEIQFYRNVSIQGKQIKAGRYIIYGIPHHDKWTIILNSNVDTWGLKQDASKDIGRFEIPITTNDLNLEYFTMVFEKSDTGANLIIAWADIIAKLPIRF
jgi:hypothetical protein